jgi:signal transduction histidine kinase
MRSDRVAVEAIVDGAVDTARRANPTADVVVADIPVVHVQGDQDRLSQALENLLTNAIKHGAPPVEVSVTVEEDTVALRVADHGRGVSQAMVGRLFDRFATGLEKGGTGLGLFIVRELARAHGGDATYDPPGRGYPVGSFVMTLPVAAAPTTTGDPEGR